MSMRMRYCCKKIHHIIIISKQATNAARLFVANMEVNSHRMNASPIDQILSKQATNAARLFVANMEVNSHRMNASPIDQVLSRFGMRPHANVSSPAHKLPRFGMSANANIKKKLSSIWNNELLQGKVEAHHQCCRFGRNIA